MQKIFNSKSIDNCAFTVVDVETTGLSARNERIIEIALVRVENLKIVDKFSTLINPQRSIPSFISMFTGITNSDVKNAPLFHQVFPKLLEQTENTVLCGHNLQFDLSFLRNEVQLLGDDFNPAHTLCTLKLARKLFPNLKSRSLGPLSYHLNIKAKNSHRALGDAETTAKVLIKLIRHLKENENINTLDELLAYQSGMKTFQSLKIKKELQNDFYELPNAPGIYYFLNSKNEIIYIGKAKSLRDRVKSYFSPNADSRVRRIIRQAKRLHHVITNSELTALLAEAESIKVKNPKHNKMLKGYGNKYFIKVLKTKSAPHLDITNKFEFDGCDYFGLYHSKRDAQKIVEFINKTFAIRECDDKEYLKSRPCFLFDIQRCTAPCLGMELNISKHNAEIEEVYRFLNGENQNAMNRLLKKMKYFAANQMYEKAAEIKKLIDSLMDEIHKSSLLSEPINKAKVLVEIISPIGNDYLVLYDGKVFIKGYLYDNKNKFEEILDDYYSGTIHSEIIPSDEDLEKLKIVLQWLIKNRNRVKVFYLKDFTSKQELLNKLNNNDSAEKIIDNSRNEPIYDFNI
ncbi:exonuclease domain-containing protein [Ignavibacterium sp.]|jgi:DNA polymerase-3 subunit epsilon|uniref:exonuclease domain-containing protein n=1 Tax=Ignavibacterium sp. TaxID=2651167 RepID=UPI0025B9AD56|nr:exonuclease domain-containing protein [Ignavibacterium sp.]